MKKKMRCLIGLILVMIIVLMAVPILAMEQNSDEIFEAEFILERQHGNIYGFEVLTGEYLIDIWHGRIRDTGNGRVEIYAYTFANRICNELDIQLLVEQEVGSTWTVVGRYTFKSKNTDSMSGTEYVQVKRGEHYRLRTIHKAVADNLSDETEGLTRSIYVD